MMSVDITRQIHTYLLLKRDTFPVLKSKFHVHSLNYVLCRKLKYDSYAICEIEYMMLLVSYMDHGVLPISLTNSYYMPSETAYRDFRVSPMSLDLATGVCSFLQTT